MHQAFGRECPVFAPLRATENENYTVKQAKRKNANPYTLFPLNSRRWL